MVYSASVIVTLCVIVCMCVLFVTVLLLIARAEGGNGYRWVWFVLFRGEGHKTKSQFLMVKVWQVCL